MSQGRPSWATIWADYEKMVQGCGRWCGRYGCEGLKRFGLKHYLDSVQ